MMPSSSRKGSCELYYLSLPTNWLRQEDLKDVIDTDAIKAIEYQTKCSIMLELHRSKKDIRLESQSIHSIRSAVGEIINLLINTTEYDQEKDKLLHGMSVYDEDGHILEDMFSEKWRNQLQVSQHQQYEECNHNNKKSLMVGSVQIPSWLTELYDFKKSIDFITPWAQIQFNCKISIKTLMDDSTNNEAGLEVNVESSVGGMGFERAVQAMQNLVVTRIKEQFRGRLLHEFSLCKTPEAKTCDGILMLQQKNPDELSKLTYGVVISLDIEEHNDVSCGMSKKSLATALNPISIHDFFSKMQIVGSDESNYPFVFIYGDNLDIIKEECSEVIAQLRKTGFTVSSLANSEILNSSQRGSNDTSWHHNGTTFEEKDSSPKRKQLDETSHYPNAKFAKNVTESILKHKEQSKDFSEESNANAITLRESKKTFIGKKNHSEAHFNERNANNKVRDLRKDLEDSCYDRNQSLTNEKASNETESNPTTKPTSPIKTFEEKGLIKSDEIVSDCCPEILPESRKKSIERFQIKKPLVPRRDNLRNESFDEEYQGHPTRDNNFSRTVEHSRYASHDYYLTHGIGDRNFSRSREENISGTREKPTERFQFRRLTPATREDKTPISLGNPRNESFHEKRFPNHYTQDKTPIGPMRDSGDSFRSRHSNFSTRDRTSLTTTTLKKTEENLQDRYIGQTTSTRTPEDFSDSFRHCHPQLNGGNEMLFLNTGRAQRTEKFQIRNPRQQREDKTNGISFKSHQVEAFQQRHPNFLARDKTLL